MIFVYYLVFVLVLATPLALFLLGLRWRNHPPKRDEGLLAYRTALSDKNDETWLFAHRHLSKLWIRIGFLLTVVSCVLMIIWCENYMSFFLWLIGGQMVFVCLSAFLVEGLLRTTFES